MSAPSEADLAVSRLWKGYAVADEEINMTLDEFKQQFARAGSVVDRASLGFWAHLRNDPATSIYVYFCDERSFTTVSDRLNRLLGILDEKNIVRGIIIYPNVLTPAARKVLTGMPQYQLEEFAETELLVNITQHTLVPQHEILSPEQKRLLLERYRLKETQLPRIQLGDPVARYYGLRRGQVVKITRPSETAGRYASYRICF
ncbi:DNA-directed RNA polymerases I, II, and III subunit RPABC1 Short=RNA polymerases I, II, and III subunit ABC1; AltName: Full=RPC24B [Serendipita indica DSM 11827]|nr:DNA-directed RNA polymerases I, II, and III subunit RPABC1 Short=RNA polymerases I, II, and III subunit ABC1; AltName: Full=RPC24B [Serendipita indica DSM 11827]